MIIKRTIKFSIQNQRNAGSRLRMRVSYNGCRVDFQTGIVLNKEYWDDVQQRVLPLNSNVAMATDLNDQLSQMLTDMIAVFREYELLNVVPTVQNFAILSLNNVPLTHRPHTRARKKIVL